MAISKTNGKQTSLPEIKQYEIKKYEIRKKLNSFAEHNFLFKMLLGILNVKLGV